MMFAPYEGEDAEYVGAWKGKKTGEAQGKMDRNIRKDMKEYRMADDIEEN